MQTADEIMNSHDLWKVGEVVSKVIQEITVSQKQSLPDTSLTVSEIKKSSRMSICMISVWKRSQKSLPHSVLCELYFQEGDRIQSCEIFDRLSHEESERTVRGE